MNKGSVATIKDVARHARVSVGTVSNVLSGSSSVGASMRARVQAAISHLDYHPDHVARSLKIKRTRSLGLVLSDITNPFFAQVLRGAEDSALASGYILITLNSDDRVEREERLLSVLRSFRVDGVLLVVAPNGGKSAHLTNLLRSGTPIVCLDRVPENIPLDCVAVNNTYGSTMCIRHLIQQGHRRIGMITGSLTLRSAQERRDGYLSALREFGIQANPELIKEGNFREDGGYRLGKELLLGACRPTAVFVANGLMTIGFIRALNELSLRCPDDIALASFDDLPLTDVFRPQITAVSQPAYQIGYEGAKLLIERLQHKVTLRSPISVCLNPELKIRASTSIRMDRPRHFSPARKSESRLAGRGDHKSATSEEAPSRRHQR